MLINSHVFIVRPIVDTTYPGVKLSGVKLSGVKLSGVKLQRAEGRLSQQTDFHLHPSQRWGSSGAFHP